MREFSKSREKIIRKRPDFYLYACAEALIGREMVDESIKDAVSWVLRMPRVRKALDNNARRVFSFTHKREATPAEIESVLKEMALLYAQTLINCYAIPRHPEEYIKNSDPQLLPMVEQLRARGRGVILATPHFGDEGMIYGSLAYLGFPVTVMINEARSYRWATGILKTLRFISLGEGALEGLKALKNNELLMLNSDMDYFPDNRTMDFFGAPYSPPHGVARLALAAQAPVLPVYSLFRGGRHQLLNDEPILLDHEPVQQEIERRILRSMELFIGRYPSHWLTFRDMWDLRGREKESRRQLAGIMLHRALRARWQSLRRPFGS